MTMQGIPRPVVMHRERDRLDPTVAQGWALLTDPRVYDGHMTTRPVGDRDDHTELIMLWCETCQELRDSSGEDAADGDACPAGHTTTDAVITDGTVLLRPYRPRERITSTWRWRMGRPSALVVTGTHGLLSITVGSTDPPSPLAHRAAAERYLLHHGLGHVKLGPATTATGGVSYVFTTVPKV